MSRARSRSRRRAVHPAPRRHQAAALRGARPLPRRAAGSCPPHDDGRQPLDAPQSDRLGHLVVVKRIFLRAVQVGAPTAAIEDIFNLKIARAYTVADTTGSASIAPASGMQEIGRRWRTPYPGPRVQRCGGCIGGTKTDDTDAIATGSFWVSAALASGQSNGPTTILDYYPNVADGEHPVVLASDEGRCSPTPTTSAPPRASPSTSRSTGPK